MTPTPSQVARAAVHQMFSTLRHLSHSAESYAADHELEESVLLEWRIAPDMFPLVAQFQLATEIPARGLSRLAGAEVPDIPNTERSFAELRERIGTAWNLIDGLPTAALDADPEGKITVPMGPAEMSLGRLEYQQGFVLPNLYFHTTTAYLILRRVGLDVGKRDFLAPGTAS